jgi:hypothetical protein
LYTTGTVQLLYQFDTGTAYRYGTVQIRYYCILA